MCGLIAYSGNEIPKKLLLKAHESMSYRGLAQSDCQNAVLSDNFFIAHNTLPLVTKDNTIYHQPNLKLNSQSFYAFTGEIFNFKDIDPKAKTDTELFQGEIDFEIVHKFDGFWNYVEVNEKALVGFNDFLSIKPLYYRTDLNILASEPYALSLVKDTHVDRVFMSNVRKWGYSPDNRTQWEEIKQLPPGCIYINGEVTKYWEWDLIQFDSDLITLIRNSVELRTRGIGKMAMLLSGGLDSSLIYSLIDKSKVKAFHVANGEHGFAKLMDPNVEELSLDSFDKETCLKIHQSPVDLGSVIPQVAMAKAVHDQGYNVIITGDGADELFGGYKRAKLYDSQMSDVFVELPYYHLPKLDRINMAYTIECRSPFLAPSIIKYAMLLPYEYRTEKQALKLAANGFVPDEILNRSKMPLRSF